MAEIPTFNANVFGGVMIRRVRWVCLMMVLFAVVGAQAQRITDIDDHVTEHVFMPNELMYYVDTTGRVGFGEITSPDFGDRFSAHPGYLNKDFNVNASYWIRIPIRHNALSRKVWLLEFYDQTIDEIEAYIPHEAGGYETLQLGDSRPFGSRLLPHKNFELMLQMPTDKVA